MNDITCRPFFRVFFCFLSMGNLSETALVTPASVVAPKRETKHHFENCMYPEAVNRKLAPNETYRAYSFNNTVNAPLLSQTQSDTNEIGRAHV